MTDVRQRVVAVPVYWLVIGIAVAFFSPLASIFAAVKIAENNAAEQAKRQEQAQALARETGRVLACNLFSSILDTYDETPPTTPAGKNQQKTWLVLYRQSRCQPPR